MDPLDPEMSLVSYLVLAGIIILYSTPRQRAWVKGYNRVQGQLRCLVFIAGGKEFEIGRNMAGVCLSSLEMKIIWVWLSSFLCCGKTRFESEVYHNVIDTVYRDIFQLFCLNYIHNYFADNNIMQHCDYCNEYFFVPSKFK